MARILIADDEKDIFDLISGFASREGHTAVHASNGAEALELVSSQDFDIIIMDVMMDEMDGFTACREIFRIKKVPVIMLTALGAEYDKLHGFELGIDDYVTKPFSPRELMARINAVLNRTGGSRSITDGSSRMEQFGRISIDKAGRSVFIDEEKINLSAKEFDILVYLASRRNQALTRRQIIDSVWGGNYYCDDRTVDWQIKLLRKNLGSCAGYIETLRGIGYKFEIK